MSSATIPLPSRRRSRMLGIPPGELTFSVLTGEHQGRQVQIRSAKCTIGSAPGCTLRLRARGVQPLHCWILRGPGGTIVRRRHKNTQLNGRSFEDSPLAPGDRLRIGSVEIEVTACPLVSADWNETATPAPIYDELDRELWERASRESAEALERLRVEMQDLERRATSQLAELNELVGRVSSERDNLAEQLRRTETDAAGRQDQLLASQQQLQTALTAAEQELHDLRTHITTRESEIEAVLLAESRRVSEIQAHLEESHRARMALEANLRVQSESLRSDTSERLHERDRLEEECQRLESQLAQLRELVGYTAAERDRLTLSLDNAQQHLLAQVEQLRREKLELEQRLEAITSQLREADRRLAALQAEGDTNLTSEMTRVAQLQQRLDDLEAERTARETQWRQEQAAWQAERERLTTQGQQLSDQCRELETPVTHLRALVESLAGERDSLCEQLEAADLRLVAEQEQAKTSRAELEERLAAEQKQAKAKHAELEQHLAGQAAQADVWQQQAAEYEEQVCQACQQLAEMSARLAQLEVSSQASLEIESTLALKWERQADESREELARVQIQLADAQTHLTAERTEHHTRLESEREQRAEWERRAAELQSQLAAAEMAATVAESRRAELEAQIAALAQSDQARASAQSVQDHEQLDMLREKLSAAESRLAGLEVEHRQRLAAEAERAVQWERKAAENLALLTAAGEQLSEVENQMAVVQGDYETRLQTAQQAAPTSQQVAEIEAARAALEAQLGNLTETIRFERETWHHDRERLHQECRMLGHRLIQKQKDLDALTDKVRAAAQPSGPAAPAGQMTVTMDQIHRQVEGATALEDERSAWLAEKDELRRQIGELRRQLDERPQFTQPFSEIQDARADGEHVAELERQVQALQAELSASRAAPSPPQATGRDGQQLAELEQHLAQHKESLAGERQALADQQARLAAEADALAAAQQEAQAKEAELRLAQVEFEGRWRDREATLQAKEQQLNQQAEVLVLRLEEVEQLRSEQAERESALEEEQLRLAQRQSQLDERHVELDEAAAQAPAAARQTSTHDSQDVDSVLGRLVQSGEWRGDEASPAPPDAVELEDAVEAEVNEFVPSPAPVPEHCATQFASSSSDASDEDPKPVWNQPGDAEPPADDDSIEAYMARLLKRVRGDAPAAAMPRLTPAPSPPVPEPEPAPADAEPVRMTVVANVEPVKPQEFVPRQKAPEGTTSLAAMRELANSAARTAIVKHQKRSGNKRALIQSVGAILTLGCSVIAAYWAYRARSLPGTAGAAIGLTAAAYWGGKAAWQALKVMMLKPPKPGGVAAMVAAIDGSDLSAASAELKDEDAEAKQPASPAN